MDYREDQTIVDFRNEVQTFISDNLPDDWGNRAQGEGYDPQVMEVTRAFQSEMAKRRWLTMAWPEEHGGLDAPHSQQMIMSEEMAYHRAPGAGGNMGVQWVGPSLMLYGTDEQKQEHLPGISDAELAQLDAPDPGPPAEPPPTPPTPPASLRIIARLAPDGRVEHGVALASGQQILPEQRFLSSDAAPGRWHVSSEIEVAGGTLGQIRARRLADGRIEWGFRGAGGEAITPDVRFLPADPAVGRWFRTTPIEVVPAQQAGE